MRLSSAREAWLRWQAAGGTWQGWSVCPALVVPEVQAIQPRALSPAAAETTHALAAELAARLATPADAQPGGTLLLLELEPALGVCIAARLNQLQLAHVVLVLPRWAYVRAILPVERLLHALVHGAALLDVEARNLPNVVLVLDAERTRPVPRRSRADARADNRYRLSPFDLPDLAALRARGIRRLVKISRQ